MPLIQQSVLTFIPVIGLIGAGFTTRARTLLTEAFWPQAEKLCYYALLPAQFLKGTATAKLGDIPIDAMASVLAGSVILTTIALELVQLRFKFNGPSFTSVLQGSIRFNNYLGISIAGALYGATGIALAAITNAILVPLVNILCTLVFRRHGVRQLSFRETLRSIVTNSLTVACLAGIILNLSGIGLPPGVGELAQALGNASLPIGLLCVGAALNIKDIGSKLPALAYSSGIKFVALPGIAVGGCAIFGLSGPQQGSLSCSLPCPPRPRRT